MVRSLVQDAPALLAYAALGGPADSIRRLEAVVTSTIDATVLEEERVRIRQPWLQRAARIAYPDVPFTGLQRLGQEGDPLLEAQAALAAGHPDPARRYLENLPALRTHSAPENIALEALYPEARMFLLLGDPERAAVWLDPSLEVVRRTDPQVLAKLTNAAALVRAAALRADLAAQAGDGAAAARWARVVAILWANADEFLQPTVRRMERLAGKSQPNPRRQ